MRFPPATPPLKLVSRRSTWIVAVTGGGALLGVASFIAWQATGSQRWLDLFFQGPGLVLMVALPAVQVWLSLAVRGAFLPDEPLHAAWSLIAFAAVCEFLGSVWVQWLSSRSPLNPLLHTVWWAPNTPSEIRQIGLFVGGTLRYALLSAGLLAVLRIYRKAGFLGRLGVIDWIPMGLVLAYVLNEAVELAAAIRRGKSPGLFEMLGWPVDPLLCLLLYQTRLLARSIERMGKGSIGRCWRSFSIAILLVWLGDTGIWATAFGHLPWEWTSLSWYVWLPAAGAFAAAPAYQLEAIAEAMRERGGPGQ